MTARRDLRPARVAWDSVDGDEGVFAALVAPERWNGWAVPYFTREEGERISAWTVALREEFGADQVDMVLWHPEHACFVVVSGEEAYCTVVEPITVDGVAYYPIGAYGWTWQEIPS